MLLPAATAAQDAWKGKAELRGKVLDEQGKGIKDAIVRIRHKESNTGPKDAKTNGSGEFRIKDLKAGDWSVEIAKEEFAVRRMSLPLADTGGDIEVKLTNAAALQGFITTGNDLFQKGDFAGARAEFEKLLAASPELTDIHRNIAYTYGREGNHAKALEHIDLLLDFEKKGETSGLGVTNASPAEMRNQLLLLAIESATKVGNTAKVKEYLGEVDDAALGEPELLINVAIGMLNKDQPEEALPIIERTASSFPSSPLPFFYRALTKLRMKENDAAKVDLEKFVTMAPPDLPQMKQAQEILSKLK